MSNITSQSNLTEVTGALLGSDQQDDEWFFVRLITAFVDAIWEQSEHSSISWSRFGGVTTYCCSIYGISCMAMALILNRTLVMASTNASRSQQMAINRNRGVINTPKSAEAMKRLSIVSFRIGVIAVLSYNAYNVLVALNLLSHVGISHNRPTSSLYRLLPDKLFRYDADYFSSTKFMKTPKSQVLVGPTTDMYWPIFLNFCLSSFTETFISVVQGKKPYTESGITIFEHSLAFQEFSSSGSIFFGNSKLHKRPTEQVLLSALFSIFTHLNIHLGGLINNNKYRLIPSSIVGIGYLAYFISSIFNGKIWGFPTILIVTFTPQVLIVVIIAVSLLIFSVAVIANGFRFQDLNYASFLMYESGDATGHSNGLHVSLNDDFYTALLNLGMLAITSAGKSSYITELSLVTLDSETWLERSVWERVKTTFKNREISEQSDSTSIIQYLKDNGVSGYGNVISQPSSRLISNGSTENSDDQHSPDSTSVFRKRNLYISEMFTNLWQLVYGLIVSTLRLDQIPNLFQTYILRRNIAPRQAFALESSEDFEARRASVPKFLRKYIQRRTSSASEKAPSTEVDIDDFSDDIVSDTYLQLLGGQTISETDNSGDYIGIASEIESDYESDVEIIQDSSITIGRTIPASAPSVTPIQELISADDFSELISSHVDILQHHLNHDQKRGILTRAKFRELTQSKQVQNFQDDESLKLLDLIAARRKETAVLDADDAVSARLECVICQTNTREIITWPCKCFAICEACRLSLVAKGIEGCVCCRRDVEGVSKVFIP